jgi:hypothetical protein
VRPRLSESSLNTHMSVAEVPETPQPEEDLPPDHPKAWADTSKYIRPRYYMARVTNEEIENSHSQWF